MNISDISKLCRCCMKEVASWEKENFNANAVEMFCFCTNIKVLKTKNIFFLLTPHLYRCKKVTNE